MNTSKFSKFEFMAEIFSSTEDIVPDSSNSNRHTQSVKWHQVTRLSLPRRSLPSSAYLLGVESGQELLPWSQSQRAKY